MKEDDSIKMSGVVTECLRNALFRVTLENNHEVMATIAGRLRKNNIKILAGDQVDLELSTYDLSKGRIFFRKK